MPQIQMADGQVIDVPDNASQELKEKIRAKNDSLKAAGSRPPPEPGLVGVQEALGLPPEGKQPAQNLFSMGPGNAGMGLGEAAGKIAGSAAGGAVAEAGLPALMAKVPPVGPIGRTVRSLGEAGMMLPVGARVAGGVGMGTGMGIVDTLSEKFGLPKAASIPASMVAGGLGQSLGQMTSPIGGQLLTAVGQLARGNASGMVGAVKAAASPKKELDEATAVALQKKLFGDKTEGYVNSLESNENRLALQAQLRKQDPSLVQGTGAGASPESTVRPIPGGGGASTVQRTEPGRSAEEISAALKAKSASKAEKEAEALAQGAKPASEIYRDRYFGGMTEAVKRGQAFSVTPEYKAFEQKLFDQVVLGNVSKGDAQKLLSSLRSDRSRRPGVQESYAESLDNRIREWGKPAEKGGQTGAAAVSAQTSDTVRGALRESVNAYTERLGLGKIEKQYRSAYEQERIAEAKDKLPLFLAGYGKSGEFEKLARNLKKDPNSKELLQVSVVKHLQNQEPQTLMKSFEKLEKVLQASDLLTLKELGKLREQASDVQRATKEGVAGSAMQRWGQVLLRTVTAKLAGEAGQAVARE